MQQQLTGSLQVTYQGLSSREVTELKARGLSNIMPHKTSRSYVQIIRENVLTTINIILFVLAIALILLGKPTDALVSVAVVLLNVIVSVVQEVRAKRTLDHIALLTRPKATVRRDGQERHIDPAEVVVGDVLLARPGDQIIVDGPILETERIDVDESLLTGESDLVVKQKGDTLFSGSFCVSGSALYQAEKVGVQSVANQLTAGARAFRRVYTPLQREINLVIRVILLAAILLEFLLVLTSIANLFTTIQVIQSSVVVIGIVPAGLFLSITVAYALGAVRMVRHGTLVQQANAVESLSRVDVLCVDKTGTLTANALQVVRLHPFNLKEDELQCLLGNFVASCSVGNATSEAISTACTGTACHIVEEVPFSSAYKWSGLVIDDGNMRGTYILGAVEMLEAALQSREEVREVANQETRQGFRVLLFAFVPTPVQLRKGAEQPTLPNGLIPLGIISLRDQLRPNVQQTITHCQDIGIQLKVISGDNPETVAALARQVGFAHNITAVSGLELAQMDEAQLASTAEQTTIFGRITPQQKEQLVGTLRQQGHYVAMIGDGVNDVLSLKQANLGVAMQSGSQAARSVADIVLLDDSFAALPDAIREGQRIRNGMQDILKLYLTRVLYFALLLIGILTVHGFPFLPKQVSIIVLLTVGLPSIALALWARPGVSAKASSQHHLWHFVVPASFTLGIFALLLYLGEFIFTSTVTITTPGGITFHQAASALSISQSAITVFAILCGLILIIFVEPPSQFWVGGDELGGDKRILALVGVMLAALVLILLIPPLRALFDLILLSPGEYLVIGILVVLWTLLVRWIWRARLMQRFLALDYEPHNVQKQPLPQKDIMPVS